MTSQSLHPPLQSPDERRASLFNVGDRLEISVNDFNEHWWPLVSNVWTERNASQKVNGDYFKVFICRHMKYKASSTRQEGIPTEKRRKTRLRPSNFCSAMIKVSWMLSSQIVRVERYQSSPDHTHSLRESDQLKRPQVIRDLVQAEAIKSYSPPAIVEAVKEYATKELHLGGSVHALRTKEVQNIKSKVRESLTAHLVGPKILEEDLQEAIKYLCEQGYQVERFNVSKRSTEGIFFAHPAQLQNLLQHGRLALIDSTHKTNKHDWRLFTLYVRNSFGCWDVGAHFFVSNEDGDTVTAALKIVRRYQPQWCPRYILADQSSIEANSVAAAFPGLIAGEQECDLLLCTVHVMRTWMKKIYHAKTREKMIMAMHKRTKIGCEEIIQNTIESCPVSPICQYITRNYLKNTHRWALWARQHSPLLLQVTSTNPLESYHSELKRTTSSHFGVIGKILF